MRHVKSALAIHPLSAHYRICSTSMFYEGYHVLGGQCAMCESYCHCQHLHPTNGARHACHVSDQNGFFADECVINNALHCRGAEVTAVQAGTQAFAVYRKHGLPNCSPTFVSCICGLALPAS